MPYKKLFFPIGGGEELEERLLGGFLITKKLNAKLDVLHCVIKPNSNFHGISRSILKTIEAATEARLKEENKKFAELFEKSANSIDESFLKDKKVNLKIKEGIRSFLVEEESKYCDLLIASAPPSGIATATFESAVLKSGKPVLMLPRVLKTFKTDKILIGWNGSTEASRALTMSIPLLKLAKEVHLISSNEYVHSKDIIENLLQYLKEHEINATMKLVKTTKIPGQALLNVAKEDNFDLIVAGAYGNRGLKELMFGGATQYLLENSHIPVFMSH